MVQSVQDDKFARIDCEKPEEVHFLGEKKLTKPPENSQKRKWSTKQILLTVTCGIIITAITIGLIALLTQRNGEDIDYNYEEDVLHKSIPIKTDIAKVMITLPSNYRMVSRAEWLAQPSGPVGKLNTPVPYVIIAHTATDNCSDQASCTFRVRQMQTFHIESRNWSDIGYNFIVGGDGSVYEGRGWDTIGAHTLRYNDKSIGLGLIGTFNNIMPPDGQLEATKRLIKSGVEQNKIAKDYKLFGHRQLIPSLSPGDVLFEELTSWDHFSKTL